MKHFQAKRTVIILGTLGYALRRAPGIKFHSWSASRSCQRVTSMQPFFLEDCGRACGKAAGKRTADWWQDRIILMFAQIRNTQMQSNPQNNIPCVFSPGRAKVEGFSVCSRTDVQAGHMLADLIEHLAANKNKAEQARSFDFAKTCHAKSALQLADHTEKHWNQRGLLNLQFSRKQNPFLQNCLLWMMLQARTAKPPKFMLPVFCVVRSTQDAS